MRRKEPGRPGAIASAFDLHFSTQKAATRPLIPGPLQLEDPIADWRAAAAATHPQTVPDPSHRSDFHAPEARQWVPAGSAPAHGHSKVRRAWHESELRNDWFDPFHGREVMTTVPEQEKPRHRRRLVGDAPVGYPAIDHLRRIAAAATAAQAVTAAEQWLASSGASAATGGAKSLRPSEWALVESLLTLRLLGLADDAPVSPDVAFAPVIAALSPAGQGALNAAIEASAFLLSSAAAAEGAGHDASATAATPMPRLPYAFLSLNNDFSADGLAASLGVLRATLLSAANGDGDATAVHIALARFMGVPEATVTGDVGAATSAVPPRAFDAALGDSLARNAGSGTRVIWSAHDLPVAPEVLLSAPLHADAPAEQQAAAAASRHVPAPPQVRHRLCARRAVVLGERPFFVGGTAQGIALRQFANDELGIKPPMPFWWAYPPQKALVFDRGRDASGNIRGRGFVNRGEMEAVLRKYNMSYDVVTDANISGMTFLEQARLVGRYGLIIVAHGAGESTLSFLPRRRCVRGL